MKLYFFNDSRQKRLLDETHYVEDIYDMIDAFFEDHGVKARFIQTSFQEGWSVTFGSFTERFVVEDYTEKDIQDAISFLNSMEETE